MGRRQGRFTAPPGAKAGKMSLSRAMLDLSIEQATFRRNITAMLSMTTFRRDLRAVVRGLWNGTFDYYDAFAAMQDVIRKGFDKAWSDGAMDVGIRRDERTADEQTKLDQLTQRHMHYLHNFLVSVEQGTRERGEKLGPHYARLELWVNRYHQVRQVGRVTAAQDRKFVWRLGPTKMHCSSCLKMAGKVKRGSAWGTAGIWPQHPDLECKGYNCMCTLEPTDLPQSKGPLPRLP